MYIVNWIEVDVVISTLDLISVPTTNTGLTHGGAVKLLSSVVKVWFVLDHMIPVACWPFHFPSAAVPDARKRPFPDRKPRCPTGGQDVNLSNWHLAMDTRV